MSRAKPKLDIATREEALALLTEHARNGSATAAAALARELRAQESEKQESDDPLDRIMRKSRHLEPVAS